MAAQLGMQTQQQITSFGKKSEEKKTLQDPNILHVLTTLSLDFIHGCADLDCRCTTPVNIHMSVRKLCDIQIRCSCVEEEEGKYYFLFIYFNILVNISHLLNIVITNLCTIILEKLSSVLLILHLTPKCSSMHPYVHPCVWLMLPTLDSAWGGFEAYV